MATRKVITEKMVCHSIRMEPMVFMTSGYFLHHSSSSGYSIWPYNYVNPHHSNSPTLMYVCITFASATGFYALTRLYRSNVKNNIDICILLLLEGLSFEFYTAMYQPTSLTSRRAIVISTLLISVPHMILILYICNMLVRKIGLTQCL